MDAVYNGVGGLFIYVHDKNVRILKMRIILGPFWEPLNRLNVSLNVICDRPVSSIEVKHILV